MDLTALDKILPEPVFQFLASRTTAEFATLSAAGFPIDTPTFYFTNEDLTSVDIATGLAYPAKAWRARKNPKVGLLIEGAPEEPVIAIAGLAAVRDADIQGNLERYLAETIFAPNVDPSVVPWDKTRERLYYLARIIVQIAPVRIRWWSERRRIDLEPSEWNAPDCSVYPASDPAPLGAPSPSPSWRQPDWRVLAEEAVAGGMPAHVTLTDDDGFPAIFRARNIILDHDGFEIDVPEHAVGMEGQASLSFVGKEVFVGSATVKGGRLSFAVTRGLPVLPMMDDRQGLSRDRLAQLNARLKTELARLGQPMPNVPLQPPQPTNGARLREQISRAIDLRKVGGGIAR